MQMLKNSSSLGRWKVPGSCLRECWKLNQPIPPLTWPWRSFSSAARKPTRHAVTSTLFQWLTRNTTQPAALKKCWPFTTSARKLGANRPAVRNWQPTPKIWRHAWGWLRVWHPRGSMRKLSKKSSTWSRKTNAFETKRPGDQCWPSLVWWENAATWQKSIVNAWQGHCIESSSSERRAISNDGGLFLPGHFHQNL